ncbi:MAG TPA: hypothetical protein VKQ36_13200 [Ktedonobacterales bacterium]|nr:hypothetical protein [Ktedonobacterales bacterium]
MKMNRKRSHPARVRAIVGVIACLTVLFAGCSGGGPGSSSGPKGSAAASSVASALQPHFDPSIGAPLPHYRIVAAYGIDGGSQVNGPASTLDMLTAFLPQLQQLGDQYAALDPIHPVKLGVDLVINSIQPCSDYPRWCSSFAEDSDIQAYIAFCKQHNMLLFLDLQLGTEPVEDAVMNHVLTYLENNSFVELALDTEFHFPNTPQGYADAEGYPCCLGWMNASEINWAIGELAQISLQKHLPRKVLIVHQWNPAVLPDKDNIHINPDVSLVLQSDGFGYEGNKLGDYQFFVQQDLLEYGGYKLFFTYPGSTSYDIPLQSPSDVMSIFPQPLFISYQ